MSAFSLIGIQNAFHQQPHHHRQMNQVQHHAGVVQQVKRFHALAVFGRFDARREPKAADSSAGRTMKMVGATATEKTGVGLNPLSQTHSSSQ